MTLKKAASFLLFLICLIALVGCSKKTTELSVTLEPVVKASSSDAAQTITFNFDFNSEQSLAMSNFVNGGLYYFSGSTLYGRLLPSDGDYLRMGAVSLGDAEARPLDGDISPAYMFIYNEYLYYVRYPNDGGNVSIAKMRPDGTELTLLYEGKDCDFLQMVGERLYFTDESHRFVSTDTNGGDMRTVINREVYYPYFLDDNYIIFQDEADGESLHLFSLSGEYDIKLNDMSSYSPVICGSYLYYLGRMNESSNFRLYRIDLGDICINADSGTGSYVLEHDTEVGEYDVYSCLTDGQMIYGANGTTAPLANWASFTDGGYDELSERACYLGEDFTIGYRLNEEEKVLEVYIDNHSTDSVSSLPTLMIS